MRTPGTVIHGTLRPQDLAEAFIAELEDIQRDPDHDLGRPENFTLRDHVADVLGRLQDRASDLETYGDDIWEDLIEAADTIGQFAPEGHYFGAHPGDGSDFGYWPHEEE